MDRLSSKGPGGEDTYTTHLPAGRYGDVKNETSFEDKLKREGGREFWKEERAQLDKEIPEGAPLTRVKNWREVLEWVEKRKGMEQIVPTVA